MSLQTITLKNQFYCEKHGLIERDEVEFWCNRCQQSELVLKDGMYLCPACLDPNQEKSFTCSLCGGKVKMLKMPKKFFKNGGKYD